MFFGESYNFCVQNAKIAKIILTFIGYFTMMMKIKKVKEIYFANAK